MSQCDIEVSQRDIEIIWRSPIEKSVDRHGASSGGKACVILVKRRRGVDKGLSIGTGLMNQMTAKAGIKKHGKAAIAALIKVSYLRR